MLETTRTITLANGLTVVLNSAPTLKRSAALLRVAAGSHDAPSRWPGLAHFLEHLFFLGTPRFAGDDALMAFVQRHGGQLNARTSERQTDYFFEVPASVFADSVQRLCDMLAQPHLGMAEQRREREVLHAEFIAWSRDAAAREQLQLFNSLAPNHPLRAFHAGNRFSLAVPCASFQSALRSFYADFYHAGQMTLSLSGPQSLDQLETLAQDCGSLFAAGVHRTQTVPPSLFSAAPAWHMQPTARGSSLIFGLENLPAAADSALAFLLTWMNAPQPGGLVAALNGRRFTAHLPYRFAGQALLQIDIDLETASSAIHPASSALLFDWLRFFRFASRRRQLRSEYAQLCNNRKLSALGLARQALETATQTLSPKATSALNEILHQLLQMAPAGARSLRRWQLPPSNPLFRAQLPAPTAAPHPRALRFDCLATSPSQTASLYLRWRWPSTQSKPARDCRAVVQARLQPLLEQAAQAGVDLEFLPCGIDWSLRATGRAAPLYASVVAALQVLAEATHDPANQIAPTQAPSMPIRRLLAELPDAVLSAQCSVEQAAPSRIDLTQTHWDGLAIGFTDAEQAALNRLSTLIPGRPVTDLPPLFTARLSREWHIEPCGEAENALLLWHPAPSISMQDEAIWRLLAHLCQTPFYQRLRVELQLGYAVFSGFRAIAGHAGWSFGVQSPNVSIGELNEHFGEFIAELPRRISSLTPERLALEQRLLAAQVDLGTLESEKIAQLFWHDHLLKRPARASTELAQNILDLTVDNLLQAAQWLNTPASNGYYLANQALDAH